MTRIKLVLFASSYAPLFLILAVRFDGALLKSVMSAFAFAGGASLAGLLVAAGRGEAQSYKIQNVKDRGSEVAGYIATYILPLIVLDQPNKEDLIGYGIFLVISGLVYIQSGMVHINPVIYLFGGRISTIVDDNGREYYLIHRSDLRLGETVWASNVLSSLLVKKLPALR